MSTQSTGRPGSAVLILGAIFATALVLRVPFGPAPVERRVATVDARALDAWSAAPLALMDAPTASQVVAKPSQIVVAKTSRLASVHTTPVESVTFAIAPAIYPQKPLTLPAQSTAIVEPQLASTPQSHFAGLAAPVTPVPLAAESPSRPFGVVGGAVGTAFVKTGAALTLAFKKTGQGLLAPF